MIICALKKKIKKGRGIRNFGVGDGMQFQIVWLGKTSHLRSLRQRPKNSEGI